MAVGIPLHHNYSLADPAGLSALLLQAQPVTGKCYVIAFSAAHNLTLADLSPTQILPVIQTWTQIYTAHLSPRSALAKVALPTTIPPSSHTEGHVIRPDAQYRYMQIFENKGVAMGCSNPHPHGQIWTTSSLPEEPAIELERLKKYRREQGGVNMLEDYARLEIEKQERVVFSNDAFLAVCPWWATWPFEIMIVARQHKRALVDFDDEERLQLAEAIAEVTRRYDNLFETSFPYSMGLHQAPLDGTDVEIEASHFHIHFYPPLLRSATVRKFLVGYGSVFGLWSLHFLMICVGLSCWRNHNGTSLPSRRHPDSEIVAESCTERSYHNLSEFPRRAVLPFSGMVHLLWLPRVPSPRIIIHLQPHPYKTRRTECYRSS